MNDRQLLSFIKIVETGSFSKVAKDSFISVPAMVQQIDRLEEDLGFRLLLRSNQGVRLTDQGKIFYDAVLEMQKRGDKGDQYRCGLKPVSRISDERVQLLSEKISPDRSPF